MPYYFINFPSSRQMSSVKLVSEQLYIPSALPLFATVNTSAATELTAESRIVWGTIVSHAYKIHSCEKTKRVSHKPRVLKDRTQKSKEKLPL
jgi:hypothetical protein